GPDRRRADHGSGGPGARSADRARGGVASGVPQPCAADGPRRAGERPRACPLGREHDRAAIRARRGERRAAERRARAAAGHCAEFAPLGGHRDSCKSLTLNKMFAGVASSVVDAAVQRIEISPNCSLSVRGAVGFWPILLFCGLEMVLLGWALYASMQRRFYRQTITVTDSDVRVESCDRACCVQVVFPRHWAQVKLRRPASRLHPSRLTIESHGRQCELGTFLTEEERRGLAARLQRLIGRVNESPSMA